MPRKIVVRTDNSPPVILQELLAADEYELQEIIKRNPDLLPIEEFEMTGPLLVVGRETALASWAVDLVALARSGHLLIVEFKTGPQNTDFRKSFAQLIDYGSDLWSLTFEEFESTVPLRYFADRRQCDDQRLLDKKSLWEAAGKIWDNFSEEEMSYLRDRLVSQLRSGSFHYVLVAQRFSQTVDRTVEYLNNAMTNARFYGVELVKFRRMRWMLSKRGRSKSRQHGADHRATLSTKPRYWSDFPTGASANS